MIKKLFIALLIPVVAITAVLLISYSFKKWENPLIAAGTVGAAISAIWAVLFLEIIKPYFDKPKLKIDEPGFKPHFYRKATVRDKAGNQLRTDYYINILLKNTGKRTAKNCQPLLIGIWERVQDNWHKELNWFSVPLQWGAGEKEEYGNPKKLREERDIIPHRPYYFILGKISTNHPDEFIISYLPRLAGQRPKIGPGEYCFEVTVTGEEVYLDPKYFYVIWRGGCTDNIEEVKQRFEVSMDDNPPT